MYTDSISPSDDLQVLIAARLRLRDFKLSIRNQYASHLGTHRAEIRQGIVEYLSLADQKNPTASNFDTLLDLQSVAQIPGKSISISHCKKLGGFACASAATPIGFCVDITQKAQYENVEKICHDFEEWQAAPSSSSLWIAKEATFKGLKQEYPEIESLPQFKLGGWSLSTAGIFEFFKLREMDPDIPPNLGCVVDLGDIKMAFFTYGTHCVSHDGAW